LDVLVAAAFAGLPVGLAEEVQLGTLFLGDRRRGGFVCMRRDVCVLYSGRVGYFRRRNT